jgi:diadenosine tetraphosphate (Ap4A) HIT family hydrolase
MGTGVTSYGKAGGGLNLKFHFHFVARKRMSGATLLPLEPQYIVWPDDIKILHLVITTMLVVKILLTTCRNM